jgi:hypothetical protein
VNTIPHIAMPIAIGGGRYRSNQQGTQDEIAACVAVICSFQRGSREEAPEFGILDPAFEQRPIDIADIQSTCETYEPRAIVRVSEAPYSSADPGAASVTVAVSVLQSEEM